MTSQLSTLFRIPERSEATPGLWNAVYDQIDANFTAVDITNSLSTLSIGADLWLAGSELIGENPSYTTRAALKIAVRSDTSDYIYFEDSSAAKSDYLLGSRVGGTADGLNLYDVSGDTMIVSFSKQSIRFYQQVVGPVFDLGGALTGTYNAATFGTASLSTESRIQAAINQALIDGVPRVYLPKSFYPFSTLSVSLNTAVQLVREGGDWTVYDVLAYGIQAGDGVDRTEALQSIESNRPVDATVFFPQGTYTLAQSLGTKLFRIVKAGTYDGPGAFIKYGGSGNLTTGSDGGGLGVINVLTNDVTISCNVHCNNKARYGIARKGETERLQFFGSIRSTLTASGVWSGIWQRASGEITGGAYVGLFPAKALSGILARPECPIMDTSNSITTVKNITAVLLGGDTATGDNTGVALAMGGAYEVEVIRLDQTGIRSSMKPLEANDVFLDLLCHDLGCNTFEMHGNPASTITDSGYFPGDIIGGLIKSNAHMGWFHYNVFSGLTLQPNVDIAGGSAISDGKIKFSGQILAGGTSALTPAYAFASDVSLGLYRSAASTMALSFGTFTAPQVVGTGAIQPQVYGLATSGNGMIKVEGALTSNQAVFELRAGGTLRWDIYAPASSGELRFYDGNDDQIMFNTSGASSKGGWKAPSGTAGVPGFRFFTEDPLGFYRSGASNIALSYGTLNLSTNTAHLWTSGISLGNTISGGGTLIPAMSSISSLVGAFVVQPSASSFTIITWAAVKAGDQILTTVMQSGAVSSLSSGLVLHSHCTQNGQIEFRLSNVSTLVQNQSSRSYFFTRISPF